MYYTSTDHLTKDCNAYKDCSHCSISKSLIAMYERFKPAGYIPAKSKQQTTAL